MTSGFACDNMSYKGRELMSEQLDRIEGLLTQLIKMVGTNNAEVKETKETLRLFRSETDVNFRKLDRRVKLIESDLDETMVKVEYLPKN